MSIITETIDQIIQQKMTEIFTEQFESLKDKVVAVIANKISSFIEENNNLRTEVQQLREARETEKKELSVVHHLVTALNTKLSEVQKQHDNAIQEMQNKVKKFEEKLESNSTDVGTTKSMVGDMLSSIPQVTSIEERFSGIEGRMDEYEYSQSTGETTSNVSTFDVRLNEIEQNLQEIKSQVNDQCTQGVSNCKGHIRSHSD